MKRRLACLLLSCLAVGCAQGEGGAEHIDLPPAADAAPTPDGTPPTDADLGDLRILPRPDVGCTPRCEGRVCGEDGCEGTCGPCPDGTFCADGRCRAPDPACPDIADCRGRQCGLDPVCATSCGECNGPFACRDGRCLCENGCRGRACGPDPCGGSCGDCAADEICTDGVCRRRPADCPAAADCQGRVCGGDPVCGTDCGDCPDHHQCQDGRCICVPDCAGRVCGSDGCEGRCGECGANGVCTDQGACFCNGLTCGDSCCGAGERCVAERCCPETWQITLPDRTWSAAAMSSDGTIYVAGSGEGLAQVAAVDACGGLAAAAAMMPPDQLGARASDLTLAPGTPSDLFVAGAYAHPGDPQDGAYARLDPVNLLPRFVAPLVGSLDQDEANGIAVTGAGAVWMTGGANLGVDPRWWIVRADGFGQACGFQVSLEEGPASGPSRRIALSPDGSVVYALGSDRGELVVIGYDAACGSFVAPCDCPLVATWHVPLAFAPVLPQDLVVTDDRIYLIGIATPGGAQLVGLGASIDRRTGEVARGFVFDPTGVGDGFLSLARRPGGFVAGGAQGWDGNLLATASPVVALLDDAMQIVETQVLPGSGLVADVLPDGPDHLRVVLTGDNAATISRCRVGACP